MNYTQESLYQLKPLEFEELCGKIIQDIIPDITNVKEARDVDFIANLNGQNVAIEVKHKLRLNIADVKRIINQLLHSSNSPTHIILMTSARLEDIDRPLLGIPSGVTFTIIWANDIVQALNSSGVEPSELVEAKERTKRQKEALSFSFIAIFGALVSFYISSSGILMNKEKAPLEKRIETVETVIGNLKDLEFQLKEIKEDMVKTQEAKLVIEKEYENAKELEKLTRQQLESIKSVIKTKSLKESLWEYFLSFVIGAASSLIVSIGFSKYKQRKTLKD